MNVMMKILRHKVLRANLFDMPFVLSFNRAPSKVLRNDAKRKIKDDDNNESRVLVLKENKSSKSQDLDKTKFASVLIFNIDAVVVYSPYYRAQCSAVDIAATTTTTATTASTASTATTAATTAAAAAAIAFHSLNHI
uniref:Uncharacterized protein n=1 Tax=Glossina austeni TaxID=7395 RepID=A0A1A9VCW7_GLOAU